MDSYLFVFEGEDVEISIELDPEITSFSVPASLINSGDVAKFEILVKDATHNQVATEACVILM